MLLGRRWVVSGASAVCAEISWLWLVRQGLSSILACLLLVSPPSNYETHYRKSLGPSWSYRKGCCIKM